MAPVKYEPRFRELLASRLMVCASCGSRVDPNRSFCTNCGSAVFVDERERRLAALRSLQRSARSLDGAAARKAATAMSAAPALRVGSLIWIVVFLFLMWTAAKWLLSIQDIVALKEGIQRARTEAVPASAPTTTSAPPPAAPEASAAEPIVRAAPGTARLPPGVSFTGNGVSMPRVLHLELPRYTSETTRARVEGSVVLYVVVRAHGEPGEITVVRSPDSRLDAQAIAAVRTWRFTPGQRAGRPVPVLVQIEIPFSTR